MYGMISVKIKGFSVKDRFLVLTTRQKALNRANFKNIRLIKDLIIIRKLWYCTFVARTPACLQ